MASMLDIVFAICILLSPCAITVFGIWSDRRYGPVLDVFVPTAVNVFNGGQVMLLLLLAVLLSGTEWFPG